MGDLTAPPDSSQPAAAPAIQVSAVRKAFDQVTALEDVDLTVYAGTLTALLGPNGAGKTTLVRIIATLARPDAGQVRVFGYDVVRRAAELTAALGLTDAAGRMVRTYSGGMHRRLDLAASLMHHPDLLVLDEPTTGLDPGSRQQLWAVLARLRSAGTTMLLTTQYLEEADRFADIVHVLHHGKVIASGTPGQLKSRAGGEGASLDDAFLALTGRPPADESNAETGEREAVLV